MALIEIENLSVIFNAKGREVRAVEGVSLSVMVPAGQPVPDVGTDVNLRWAPSDVHYMDDAA